MEQPLDHFYLQFHGNLRGKGFAEVPAITVMQVGHMQEQPVKGYLSDVFGIGEIESMGYQRSIKGIDSHIHLFQGKMVKQWPHIIDGA